MHCSEAATHPLRGSWRAIRNKIRMCRQTQYDLTKTYFSGNNNKQYRSTSFASAVRPNFVTSSVEQQIYTILVTFLDQVMECYHTMCSSWACKKFGRQLACILRAINFDHGYCWRLLENRILYYLILKHYSMSILLAWHAFIDTLSDAVTEGFWQATLADLPKQLPTIFEDTPAKCFLSIEPKRPSFSARLLNLFVCLFF
uniref:Gamma-tubulin complex component n=1 Tax=Setaria digitata TaxID=48799 RepID=A0A915PR15_9BILA